MKQTSSFHALKEHQLFYAIHSEPNTWKISNSNPKKGQVFAWARPFKEEGENACLNSPSGPQTCSSSCHPEEPSTAGESGKHQCSCKPKLRATGTGCVQVTLALTSQQKAVPCRSPCFQSGFEKMCLLEAWHEAFTWGKNENLESKSHKPHSCFNTVFLHWRGPGKKPIEAKQARTKEKAEWLKHPLLPGIKQWFLWSVKISSGTTIS